MKQVGRVWMIVGMMTWIGFAGGVSAQETKTIQGEVVDPALYLRDGRHGKEVEDLIYDAVDGGQALALLEDGTSTLYLLLAGEPGSDPNELVYEYAGRHVKATGTVYERGGVKGLVVTGVAPLEGQAVGMPQEVEP